MRMMHRVFFCSMLLAGHVWAQSPVALPEVTVYSSRVANQDPAAGFAMPVSALRYEPGVDLQTRNLAEAQADVTLRGGTFEATGYRLGAVSLPDPQTGHYTAEIPVAPTLLSGPEIATGALLARDGFNATTGVVSQTWRPITNRGFAAAGAGEFRLARGEFYQGVRSAGVPVLGSLGADVAWARATSEGAVPWGEQAFERVNGRLQLAGPGRQTDLFAGYQAKAFGWPNLYTPFNSNESENLQTVLFALNHRADYGPGEFWTAGMFHRRNKDDYAFNRFAPLGPIHPYQHTTWISGAAANGRVAMGTQTAIALRAEFTADELRSTSLTFGRYRTRTLAKLAVLPEWSLAGTQGARWLVRAGFTWDDSNRDRGRLSPVLTWSREFPGGNGLTALSLDVSRATQLPTYTALNSSPTAGLFRGNPNLGRTVSDNAELSARGRWLGWDGRAAAFVRRDVSLVDWTFRRGVTARIASPVDVEVSGLELVLRRTWRELESVVGFTWLDKAADYRGAIVDGSFYTLNYARQRLTAALVWRPSTVVDVRVDNSLRRQNGNPLRTTGGAQAWATACGVNWRPAGWRGVQLSAQVDNMWNDHFQETPAVPATPRQVSVSVMRRW
jgi:hypothetical protein